MSAGPALQPCGSSSSAGACRGALANLLGTTTNSVSTNLRAAPPMARRGGRAARPESGPCATFSFRCALPEEDSPPHAPGRAPLCESLQIKHSGRRQAQSGVRCPKSKVEERAGVERQISFSSAIFQGKTGAAEVSHFSNWSCFTKPACCLTTRPPKRITKLGIP